MSGDFIKKLFLFSFLLMGGLYAVQWERHQAAGKYVDQLAELLDDRQHPGDSDFVGRRARLCQMLTVLQEATEEGLNQRVISRQAARQIGMEGDYAEVLAEALEQATRTALSLGLLDPEGRSALAAGILPEISKGPYVGGDVDVEFVVPLEHAPQLEAYFANMMLRPVLLTEELGIPVDNASYQRAGRFYQAELISQNSFARIGNEYEENLRR